MKKGYPIIERYLLAVSRMDTPLELGAPSSPPEEAAGDDTGAAEVCTGAGVEVGAGVMDGVIEGWLLTTGATSSFSGAFTAAAVVVGTGVVVGGGVVGVVVGTALP